MGGHMYANEMAARVIDGIETRVFRDISFVECPNCGYPMEVTCGGPTCEQIDEGDPRTVEYVGFKCGRCNASIILSQVFEPVPDSLEVAIIEDEISEEWRR